MLATAQAISPVVVYVFGGVLAAGVTGAFGYLVKSITSSLKDNTHETVELSKIVVELKTEQRDILRRVEKLERVP